MSDFEDKLNTLLNDPKSMGQIMQLAQNLSGGDKSAEAQSETTLQVQEPPAIDPQILQKFMPILREMQSAETGEAARFLTALRPYLRPEKQEKVGKAIEIARIIRIGKTFFRQMEDSEHV